MYSLTELHTKISALQPKISEIEQKRARLQGRLDAAKASLAQSGFDSIEAAETWLATAKQQLENDTVKVNDMYKEFMNEYGRYLE